MLKINPKIDLEWLKYEFGLRYCFHVDEQGKYLFYSETFFISPYDRVIHIEGRNMDDLLFLYDLIKADMVVKE